MLNMAHFIVALGDVPGTRARREVSKAIEIRCSNTSITHRVLTVASRMSSGDARADPRTPDGARSLNNGALDQ